MLALFNHANIIDVRVEVFIHSVNLLFCKNMGSSETSFDSKADQVLGGLLGDKQDSDLKIPEAKIKGSASEQIRIATERLGPENVLGPEDVSRTFGVNLREIPGIPFSVKELERAKELGQRLILRVDKAPDGGPMSFKTMKDIVQSRWAKEGKGSLVYTIDEYRDWERRLGVTAFFKDPPRSGWALVSTNIIPESVDADYLKQTQIIINVIKNEIFKNIKLPEEYALAVTEFESQKHALFQLTNMNSLELAKRLVHLRITRLARPTAQEIIYDLAMYYDKHNKALLSDRYAWSGSISPRGLIINIGDFLDARGVEGDEQKAEFHNSAVGAIISRRI